MNRTLGLVCAAFLSLGVISLACSSGETVEGPLQGQAGMVGNPGTAGSNPGPGAAGSNPGPGAAGTTGVAGSPGRGGSTGVAGSPGRGGTTGVAGSPGRGGTTGVAGAPGHGGTMTTGVAGTTGAAGAGNATGATTCVMGLSSAPQVPLITDFSDAGESSGEFKFGSSTASAQGGTSRFASGATKGTLTLAGGALTFAATVDKPTTATMYPFSGFAVYINGPGCVNASSYTGVSFMATGVSATCPLVFGFGDADHTAASDDPDRGLCAGTCYGAQFAVTSGANQISFTATPASTGMPMTPVVNKAKLTGIQFQFKAPDTMSGCSGSITVDNIKFY